MRFLSAAGLVMILSGLGARYATGDLSVFSVANLVAGPLALVLAAVFELRRFRGFSGALSRAVMLRWGVILVLVACAVVATNLLASRGRWALDWTAERQYSLSAKTGEICREIEQAPAERQPRLLFFEDAKLARDVALLAAVYRADCGIEVQELREADAPPEAREILRYYETTLVACRTNHCEPVGFPSEYNVSNALLRLIRASHPIVYFALGHGEADPSSEGSDGLAGLAAALRDIGLEVRAYVSPARTAPPGDANLVILAAPARNLLEPEIEGLEGYLEGGGRMLVLLEPGQSPNLHALLGRWGFGLPEGLIADTRTSPLLEEPEPISLIVNRFSSSHAVTRQMSRRTMVLLPSARPVFPERKPRPQDRLAALLFSNRSSWIESDVDGALSGRPIRADDGEAAGREFPLLAAGTYVRDAGETRIVVIGDRDLASNRLLMTLYNRDLLLNTVHWLVGEEARAAIADHGWTPHQHPLTLQQTLTYFYFLAFALPEILLLLGIHAWYRQRG